MPVKEYTDEELDADEARPRERFYMAGTAYTVERRSSRSRAGGGSLSRMAPGSVERARVWLHELVRDLAEELREGQPALEERVREGSFKEPAELAALVRSVAPELSEGMRRRLGLKLCDECGKRAAAGTSAGGDATCGQYPCPVLV